MIDRAGELADFGVMLKRLAHQWGLAVVVTNQVSDRMGTDVPATGTDSEAGSSTPEPMSESCPLLEYEVFRRTAAGLTHPLRTTRPTLGQVWSQMVNTRYGNVGCGAPRRIGLNGITTIRLCKPVMNHVMWPQDICMSLPVEHGLQLTVHPGVLRIVESIPPPRCR